MLALPGAGQSAAQVQTGPIDEPRGQEQRAPQVSKGARAIREQREKCSTRWSVNADALFAPNRWTLNPDAAETLDVLGPRIAKSGKHPAHIDVYTAASESAGENRDVAQRRALTVRTWLVDSGFLPKDTSMDGFSGQAANAGQTRPSTAPGSRTRHSAHGDNNGTVIIAIELCSNNP